MRMTKAFVLDEGCRDGAKRVVSYNVDCNNDELLTIFETEQQDGQTYIPARTITFDRYQMTVLFYFLTQLLEEE